MKITVSRNDTLWSYIGIILAMGANLLMLPVVLTYLNDDAIGLYYVLTSLSAIATLFDFGFSPSFARSIAYAWSGTQTLENVGITDNIQAEPNFELMDGVMRTCRVVYSVLAGTALVIGLTVGTYYIQSITKDFDGLSHLYAWFVYLVAIVLNIYYGYYSVLLRGVGAVADVNKSIVFSRLVQIVFCVLLCVLKCGLVGIAVAYLSYGLLFRVLARRKFYKYKNIDKKLGEARECRNGSAVKTVLSTIWSNTWRDGLVTLSNYLLNQATTIIASLYLSLYETGVYSLCVQLATAIVTVAGTLYTTYQPALQSSYANKDVEAQRRYMSVVVVSFWSISLVGILCMLIIGRPLINLLKPSYAFDANMLLIVWVYQFLLKLRNCYATYFSTTNRLIYTRSFVISAVVCVALSLVSCIVFKFGVFGLVFSQITSQILFCSWYWMIKAHKELNLSLCKTVALGVSEIKKLIRRTI